MDFVQELILKNEHDADGIAQELTTEAYERLSGDNITVIVVIIAASFRGILSKDSVLFYKNFIYFLILFILNLQSQKNYHFCF
jgi:hypothetical protein